MDYGEIVNKSFALAWRHKSLWVLGLFASGGVGFPFLWEDHDFRAGRRFIDSCSDWSILPSWVERFEGLIPLLIAVFVMMVIIWFVLSLICTAGLVDAVNRLTRGGQYRLGQSFAAGARFFWRFLGLFVLGLVAGLGGFFAIVMVSVVAFVMAVPLGVLSLIITIPAALAFGWFLITVFTLAERAVVVRNATVEQALREGYYLWRHNLLPSLIIALIYIALTIGIMIGVMIVMLIVAIPFAVLALASGTSLLIGLLIGIPLFLLLSLPVSGFLGAAFETIYTLFYFRLVEPPSRPGQVEPQTG